MKASGMPGKISTGRFEFFDLWKDMIVVNIVQNGRLRRDLNGCKTGKPLIATPVQTLDLYKAITLTFV